MSFLIASGHVEVEAKTDKAMSAITGIVGAMGALGPVAGVAAASLAAAGAGVAAFGAAAGKQVADIKKASDAQGKYQDAVDKSGKHSQDAAKAQLAYTQQLAKMPKATQEASAAFSALKDSYSEWSDSLAGDTMPVFTKSFAIFQALLPKTTGLVKGTSAELDRLLTVIAGGVASPGFDRFMAKLTDLSSATLHAMTDGLINMSQALNDFGAGGGFDQFIATAKEAGPLLGDTLKNIGKALLNLTAAGSDVGISILSVANAFAKLVSAIPPEVLSNLLQLYAAFKLVKLAAAGVVALSGGLTGFAASLTVMRAASVGAGGGIAGLAAAFGTLGKAAKATIVVAGIAAAVMAITKLADLGREAPPNVDRLTTSLGELGRSGKVSGETARLFGKDLDGLYGSVRNITDPSLMDNTQNAIMKIATIGLGSSTPSKEAKARLDGIDESLTNLVKGGKSDMAAAAFKRLSAEYAQGGHKLGDFTGQMDSYKEALKDQAFEQQLAADAMGIFGQMALDTSRKLDAQKTAADGLRQSILNLNDTNRAAYDAQIAFEQGIDDLTASFKEHGATLDLDTDAGRKNGAAMSTAAKGHDEMLAAGIAAGESLASMTGKSDTLRASMMRLATDAFDGNKKKATEYVNTLLGTPSDIKTMIRLEKREAVTGLEAVRAAIAKTPGAKSVKVDTLNAAAIKALEAVGFKTKQLPDGRTEVSTKNGQAIGSIAAVARALANLDGKTATTWTFHNIKTNYSTSNSVSGGKSVHDMVGATGGLFTGSSFRHGYAGGGPVSGPGTGTSDDVFAPWLSNGEWVIKAAAVRKYGDRFLSAVNDGSLKPGPHFAKGGKLTAKQKAAQEAAKKQAAAEKTAKSGLTSDFGISGFGTMAGYKRDPFEKSLGVPASVSDLVTSLNEARGKIKAASHGKTESSLLKRLDSSGKALIANQKKLEGVNKALESAKGKLDDLKGKFDSLKTSVSSSLVGFGNITKIGKYGTSPDTLIKQLSSDAGRTTEFAKQLEQLKGKGLNAQSISEIAQAGVTGGGMATAQSLLKATPQQIAEINALEKQLQASADKAGTVTADAMYGAGVRAAEGLVKGLTAQQSAIEAAMMTIAKAMEASIKKALGIRSPSKVMEPIGDYSFQGVEQGWVKRMARGNTLISGSNLGVRMRPAVIGAGAAPAASVMAPVVNLTATFNTMTLPAPTERKAFAVAMAKDINDALFDYQKERRR